MELDRGHGGLLRLRLEFDPDTHALSSGASFSSESGHRTLSMASPSRFSMRNRRPGAEHDDS